MSSGEYDSPEVDVRTLQIFDTMLNRVEAGFFAQLVDIARTEAEDDRAKRGASFDFGPEGENPRLLVNIDARLGNIAIVLGEEGVDLPLELAQERALAAMPQSDAQ